MILTKRQSIQYFNNLNKSESVKFRYKYTSKTKANCISCMKTIYISYRQFGRNGIFCEECWKSNQRSFTIAQYQYMRRIKEQQMRFIEGSVTKMIKNDE